MAPKVTPALTMVTVRNSSPSTRLSWVTMRGWHVSVLPGSNVTTSSTNGTKSRDAVERMKKWYILQQLTVEGYRRVSEMPWEERWEHNYKWHVTYVLVALPPLVESVAVIEASTTPNDSTTQTSMIVEASVPEICPDFRLTWTPAHVKGTVQSNSTICIIISPKRNVCELLMIPSLKILESFPHFVDIYDCIGRKVLWRLLCTYLLICDVEILVCTDALFQEGLLCIDTVHSFWGCFSNFIELEWPQWLR